MEIFRIETWSQFSHFVQSLLFQFLQYSSSLSRTRPLLCCSRRILLDPLLVCRIPLQSSAAFAFIAYCLLESDCTGGEQALGGDEPACDGGACAGACEHGGSSWMLCQYRIWTSCTDSPHQIALRSQGMLWKVAIHSASQRKVLRASGLSIQADYTSNNFTVPACIVFVALIVYSCAYKADRYPARTDIQPAMVDDTLFLPATHLIQLFILASTPAYRSSHSDYRHSRLLPPVKQLLGHRCQRTVST